MNIIFEGPKNQNSTFFMSADGSHNFWLYFYVEKIQNNVSGSMFWLSDIHL
jgi:hypothetical protein